MITASTNLKNTLYNNTNIQIDSGCYIEYNMNNMLDNISATNNIADSAYTGQIVNIVGQPSWPSSRPNPYKKLFPVDSLIKPFRPASSGIKYFILADADTYTNSFSSYRSVKYPEAQPRIYYPGVETFYKYWVTPINTGANVTINYATSGTQYALANKIVLRFEKNHTLPSTYTVVVTKSDNTQVTAANALSVPSDGNVTLYYNGTSWSATAPAEPMSFGTPLSIKSINVTTPSAGAGKIIGLIEVSARWIKDISSDVVSFEINKESSSSSEDILPVGKVTANSLNLNLAKYNQLAPQYVSYNRTSTLDSSLTYIYKNAVLNPYFKIYHSNGAITEGSKKYDKVSQGYYYVDSWDIDTYGESSITALDNTKYLMETVAPDILCEYYPATAVIRRLLDSVGFTNYSFNLTSDTDSSIPFINYFWTDGTKTVWENIQELCRDIQMNAVMDENNILQFYSRNYMYSRTIKDWNFYHEKDGDSLPNIIDFDQKEIASANQVKILWSTPISSTYLGASGPLWQSPTSYLIAGGLKETLTSTSNKVILDLGTLDKYSKFQSGFNFNGYFMIDSEIIEFDAIGYQYIPKDLTPSTIYDALTETNVLNNGSNFINIWIENSADVNKYRNFSKVGSSDINSEIYFKPNGAYRVKTRGALGTTAAPHNASGVPSTSYFWTGTLVTQNA
jgi:hypothetical protein